MIAEIVDSRQESVLESDISQLEENIGRSLPWALREFLRRHNGGRPEPDVIDIPGIDGGSTDVQEFFGFGHEDRGRNITWYLANERELVGSGKYPFACDSGGNVFCIGEDGTITYQDTDGTLYDVAASLSAFLSKIRPF